MVEITPQQILLTIVAGCLAAVTVLAAEWLHWRRIQRLRILTFGPAGQLSWAAYAMSPLRVFAVAALAWSLTTLFFLAPRIRTPGSDKPVPFHKLKHIVLILDVSPSHQSRSCIHQIAEYARCLRRFNNAFGQS